MNNDADNRFDLPALLTLEGIGDAVFRSARNERNNNNRVFGGQLMGQCVAAALRTVPAGRAPSLLQMVFLSGARSELPIDYSVTVLQEGKTFSTRHVIGRQGQTGVASAHVSCERSVFAPRHQVPMGDVKPPEQLDDFMNIDSKAREKLGRTGYMVSSNHPWIDWRLVDPETELLPAGPGTQIRFWVKVRQKLGDDPNLHAAALAYLSDWWLNFIAIAPHLDEAADFGFYIATLNHSIWFNAPVKADEWLLFVTESPWANNTRGMATGRIYQNGVLAANVAQDALQTARLPGP